jgi:predicted DNA-binding transcriptional regulator AlpA
MSGTDASALLLSPKATAKMLGICTRTLTREIARGRFPPPLKIRSSSRFHLNDVTQYLERLLRERGATLPTG